MIELIDTHCHLSTLEHAPLAEILERAEAAFVKKMICIGAGNGKKDAFLALDLAKTHPHIWASVGVHPHSAATDTNLEGLEEAAAEEKVVAIGETGLDFYRDWAPKEQQFELFRNTISLALNLKKPLIIHSRAAGEECFSVLKEMKAEQVGGVFHCYAEDALFASRLRDLNFLVSFPGSITFKSAEQLRAIVKEIPLEQIMLETDAPFMAPEPFRGKPSEPAHVYQIASKLAQIKDLSLEEVARTTSTTAKKFFRI